MKLNQLFRSKAAISPNSATSTEIHSIIYNPKSKIYPKGFTIVELLVVIVVIGILAAITIVSYSGISRKATEASVKSDLSNSSTILKMYKLENDVYPNSIDDTTKCPTPADTRYCLKFSADTTFTYTGGGQSFSLTVTKNSVSYQTNENDTIAGITPLTAIAAITGTTEVSQTLTAGALTPSGATATYQWQSATTADGTYTNISGATSSTYIVSPSQISKYFKVVATGTDSYSGTVTSTASSQVAANANWLTVGAQTWAKANQNIGVMVTNTTEQANNATLEKYCYSNTESNCTTYGGLYQWDEAMQYVTTEGAQGICPAGSHIPSDNDWKILEMQLGMTQVQADSINSRGTDQGTQLKSGGSSGLNLPLTGRRSTDWSFGGISSLTYLWSSSESDVKVWSRGLFSGEAIVGRLAYNKAYGFSVRCVGN